MQKKVETRGFHMMILGWTHLSPFTKILEIMDFTHLSRYKCPYKGPQNASSISSSTTVAQTRVQIATISSRNKTWVSFEDSSSVDVKGKYARVRGLAGLALQRAELDKTTPCGSTLRTALAKVLNSQSRAPRAVVLRYYD